MPLLLLYSRLIHKLRNHLARTGSLNRLEEASGSSRTLLWLRSLLSVLDFNDFQRLDLPWWTFTTAKRVEEFLSHRPDGRVFEWGSGASTVWLSKRAAEVYSVESDPLWASQVQAAVGENAQIITSVAKKRTPDNPGLSRRLGYRQLDFSAYVDAIDEVPGRFDLIVIDGRARPFCLAKAVDRLAPGGMIVFDNTNRLRYRRSITQWSGLLRVNTDWGLTPILPWPSMTSILQLSDAAHAASAVDTFTR